jgi:hypothetical protein
MFVIGYVNVVSFNLKKALFFEDHPFAYQEVTHLKE